MFSTVNQVRAPNLAEPARLVVVEPDFTVLFNPEPRLSLHMETERCMVTASHCRQAETGDRRI